MLILEKIVEQLEIERDSARHSDVLTRLDKHSHFDPHKFSTLIDMHLELAGKS